MSVVPTIGVEFATKIVTLPSGVTIKAQIWDTAGQERYLAITRAHYQRAVGALLVYDITNVTSFQNVIRWIHEIKENGGPDIIIMLVGNKVDNESSRQITREQGAKFAEEHGLLFEETSAHTAIRVRESFESLLKEIYAQKAKF
jgi:Rab family protein